MWIASAVLLVLLGGQDAALAAGLQLAGQVDGRLHAALRRCQPDLGAIAPHQGAALQAHVLGHDQDHAVALDGRHHGQGYARIAAGGLNEGVPGADVTPLLRPADHGQGRAVLDRSRGVVALQLGQDVVVRLAWQALEARQWRVADEFFDGRVDHGMGPAAPWRHW